MYELIRDRIGEILIDEIQGQISLGHTVDFNSLYTERFVPIDKVALNCINITVASGRYDNKDATMVDGNYVFYIDYFTGAKSTDTQRGDELASKKCQKGIGLIRAILENQAYATLGYADPFNCHTEISEIGFATPETQDGLNVQMGRITFLVRIPETSPLKIPVLIYEYHTEVKLSDTDKGYIFQGQDTEPDPPTCSPAILNVNGLEFESIPSGGTFDMEVVDQNGNQTGSPNGSGQWEVNTGEQPEEDQFEFLNVYE